jgi:uncharacterized repeat protein (TIGR03803 family)
MQIDRRRLSGPSRVATGMLLAGLTAIGIFFVGLLAIGTANAGTLKTLYLFGGGKKDGGYPVSRLLPDGAGGFYGTSEIGGGNGCKTDSGIGCGTVFHYSASGKESVLYSFKGGSDGASPYDPVIMDSQDNLYGTTGLGGNSACNAPSGCGTVFKIAPDGTETMLYVFNGSEGAIPVAPLIADAKGNLYGTTEYGGNPNCSGGCGAVFEIMARGKYQTLYSFTGGADGAHPVSALLLDNKGNVTGTAPAGGIANGNCSGGCGTVFGLSPKGKFTTLYAFQGGSDGAGPTALLIADAKGNFYSTTGAGGDADNCSGGCGTVFRLTPKGKKTILYTFSGQADGANPSAGVSFDSAGNLFGTTVAAGYLGQCGTGCGTVFEIDSSGGEHTLYTFQDAKDGAISYWILPPDSVGNLYGLAEFDGGGKNQACEYGCGILYRLSQ